MKHVEKLFPISYWLPHTCRLFVRSRYRCQAH